MTAEADRHFQQFRLLRKMESYPDFTLYLVEFKSSNSVYPAQALLKEYHSCTPEASKEISMLIDISIQAPECHVVKYLHHIFSRKKLYVFLEKCDETLARVIGERKRSQEKWTEGEVLHYLQGLLDTLRTLHVKRIAHRNINPATLLVQGKVLKLAHFDDSKQVHVGTTLVPMTSIHGFETYLSPQLYQAYRCSGINLEGAASIVPYQATYKDDIWAVGRVVYDMLTLRNQEDMLSLLDEGERGFITCVERDLSARGFSCRITAILLHMLTFDPEKRLDAARLLEEVSRELSALQSCYGNCGGWKRLLKVCEHYYCESCLTTLVAKAIQANGTLESLHCTECGPLSAQHINELAITFPAVLYQLDLLRLNQIIQCPTLGCPHTHTTLQIASGAAKNYQVSCECGSKYCSYCHASGGHGVLGLFARCPTRPF
jgi:serine/threonine protein kinase